MFFLQKCIKWAIVTNNYTRIPNKNLKNINLCNFVCILIKYVSSSLLINSLKTIQGPMTPFQINSFGVVLGFLTLFNACLVKVKFFFFNKFPHYFLTMKERENKDRCVTNWILSHFWIAALVIFLILFLNLLVRISCLP